MYDAYSTLDVFSVTLPCPNDITAEVQRNDTKAHVNWTFPLGDKVEMRLSVGEQTFTIHCQMVLIATLQYL